MRRPAYNVIDVLKQARGLPRPEGEGFVVITVDFCKEVEAELKRLYDLEDMLAAELVDHDNDNPDRMTTPSRRDLVDKIKKQIG